MPASGDYTSVNIYLVKYTVLILDTRVLLPLNDTAFPVVTTGLCFHRLMVNLTQPAMLCFGKVPDDPVFRHHFLQVTSHLQDYKEV